MSAIDRSYDMTSPSETFLIYPTPDYARLKAKQPMNRPQPRVIIALAETLILRHVAL